MSHEALDKIKNTAILPSTAIISASALTPLTRSSFSTQKLKALYMESSPSSDLESNDNVDGAQQQQQQQQQQQHAARAAKENVNGNHHRRGDDASMSPASSKEEEEEDDDDDDEEEEEEGGDNSEDESKNDGGSDCEEEGEGADVAKLAVTPSPNADRDVDVDVDAVPLAPATTKTNDGESPPPPSSTEELADLAARRSAWPMSGIAEPGLNDCLFGRGGGTNHHPGNKLYRKIVEDRKEVYLTSKRLDKPLVAMNIINEWRALDPPGRFLKQNDKTKLWEDVGDKKAREKTSQALREKTPTKQREGEERGGGGGGGDVTWGGGGGGSSVTRGSSRVRPPPWGRASNGRRSRGITVWGVGKRSRAPTRSRSRDSRGTIPTSSSPGMPPSSLNGSTAGGGIVATPLHHSIRGGTVSITGESSIRRTIRRTRSSTACPTIHFPTRPSPNRPIPSSAITRPITVIIILLLLLRARGTVRRRLLPVTTMPRTPPRLHLHTHLRRIINIITLRICLLLRRRRNRSRSR